MSATCVSEPISWLRLERYALGEALDAVEIARHLAECEACRACYGRVEVESDVPLRPLHESPPRVRSPWRRAAVATGSALALAAAVVLVAGRRGGDPVDPNRIKGSEISFTLVRDDDTVFAEAGGSFRDGDRFKALVTCAPGTRSRFDLVVYDDEGATFPVDVPPDFACGNAAPLPGAFKLRGAAPMHVCLVWGDGPPDRHELSKGGFDPDRPRVTCKRLVAAP